MVGKKFQPRAGQVICSLNQRSINDHVLYHATLASKGHLNMIMFQLRRFTLIFRGVIMTYKKQRAYLAVPVGDIKGLMILKYVFSCSKPSYCSVQISPRF